MILVTLDSVLLRVISWFVIDEATR